MSFYLNMKKTINEDLALLNHYNVDGLVESRKDVFHLWDRLMYEPKWEILNMKVLVMIGNDLSNMSSVFFKKLGIRYPKKHKNFFSLFNYIGKIAKDDFYIRPTDVEPSDMSIAMSSELKPRSLAFYKNLFGSLVNFKKFMEDEFDIEWEHVNELIDLIKSRDSYLCAGIEFSSRPSYGTLSGDYNIVQYTTKSGEAMSVDKGELMSFINSQGWSI